MLPEEQHIPYKGQHIYEQYMKQGKKKSIRRYKTGHDPTATQFEIVLSLTLGEKDQTHSRVVEM